MYVYGIGMEDNTDETDPILLDVLKKKEIGCVSYEKQRSGK